MCAASAREAGLIVALAAGLVVAGCGDEKTAEAPVTGASGTGAAATGPADGRRGVVFRDLDSGSHGRYKPARDTLLYARARREFDNIVARTGYDELEPVDFSKRQIVAVFLGPAGGGESVRIAQIREQGRFTVVRAIHQVPGENCVSTAVLTNPYVIAESPRTQGEFKLELVERSRDC